jgi:hypothetical protein
MNAFVAVNSEVYEDKGSKDKSQRKWGERGFLMLEYSSA